jgi:hypothetical protein
VSTPEVCRIWRSLEGQLLWDSGNVAEGTDHVIVQILGGADDDPLPVLRQLAEGLATPLVSAPRTSGERCVGKRQHPPFGAAQVLTHRGFCLLRVAALDRFGHGEVVQTRRRRSSGGGR